MLLIFDLIMSILVFIFVIIGF